MSKTYKHRKQSSDSSSDKSVKVKQSKKEVQIVADPKLSQRVNELTLELTQAQFALNNLKETHLKETTQLKQAYEDRILKLEAEVEELYSELEKEEEDDAKLQ